MTISTTEVFPVLAVVNGGYDDSLIDSTVNECRDSVFCLLVREIDYQRDPARWKDLPPRSGASDAERSWAGHFSTGIDRTEWFDSL